MIKIETDYQNIKIAELEAELDAYKCATVINVIDPVACLLNDDRCQKCVYTGIKCPVPDSVSIPSDCPLRKGLFIRKQ